ncbi:MAG: phosphoglycerate dehydrogenase [Alphaproteobacteria bacterium]|nr:phosphoglycerate dehydrogenase [Alphaproteobacteria bacterium]
MSELLSLPKDRIKILLLEGVNDTAVQFMGDNGYAQITRLPKALDGEALKEALRGVHLLGIRSRTQLTADVLDAADRLVAVGCFCIGTNQVDLAAARERGIVVFNAPFSNTRSVAELVMGEIIVLLRGVLPKSNAAHAGVWQKTADGFHEVRGRTLGIVGYGNIGSQLSVLAEAFGMRVLYFDVAAKLPHGNASRCATLDELLNWSDIVTMHVPETAATMGMMGEAEFAKMRAGAIFINNARGTVVDLDALAAALRSGHLAGAAVDVFPEEPARNGDAFATPLAGIENVILTPHIGGSTEEAQARIGEEVAAKLVDYSDTGSTVGAVNFPGVQLPPQPTGVRFMHVHRNVPGILTGINTIFAKRGVNIAGQYLQTEGDVGYVVVDGGASRDSQAILEEMRALPGTIRARLLYER